MIYTMAVPLGFATTENTAYRARHGFMVLIPRTMPCVPGHLGFGVAWGMGLAVAQFHFRNRGLFLTTLPYILIAAVSL